MQIFPDPDQRLLVGIVPVIPVNEKIVANSKNALVVVPNGVSEKVFPVHVFPVCTHLDTNRFVLLHQDVVFSCFSLPETTIYIVAKARLIQIVAGNTPTIKQINPAIATKNAVIPMRNMEPV